MADLKDIIQNIEQIYGSNNSLNILKDFERVLDELDIYVFDNWFEGELVQGPKESRYFIECTFMWPYKKMPEPKGGKKLIEHGCKVEYAEDFFAKVRQINDPKDIRPGTRKGKIDYFPIWMVKITMPKKLIQSVETGYSQLDKNQVADLLDTVKTANNIIPEPAESQSELADEEI